MLKKLLFPFVLLSAITAKATFVPVSLSGFNQDVIANGVGNANLSTTSSCDLANWCLLSLDFKATAASAAPTNGLPINGTIISANTSGLVFQLGNYTGNNGLVLTAVNSSGTLTFGAPVSGDVYVLGFAGNGPTNGDIRVNFTDATSQTFSNVTFNDWYGATGFAIKSIGRIDRTNNTLDAQGNPDNPRLYEHKLTLNNANYAKQIASITVTKTNSAGVLNVVAASVCQVPVLGLQPVSATICNNATIGFSVSATNAVDFQWQVNTGSGYTNIANNAVYSGALIPNLSISSAPASYNGYRYRCAIKSACGATVYSSEATLTVLPDLVVTAYSNNMSACTRASFELSLKHDGVATSYQWQISTPNTAGYVDIQPVYPYLNTQTSKLRVEYTDDSLQSARFRCVLSGPCGSISSPYMVINLIQSPFISDQPDNDTIPQYTNAEFHTSILGSDYITYWQSSSNGVDYVNINDNALYSGSKGFILGVKNAPPTLNGMKFRCILKSTNPVCLEMRDTTEVATLVINNPNDIDDVNAAETSLYPNPVKDNLFYISSERIKGKDVGIVVVDKFGKLVHTLNTTTSGSRIAIDLPAISAGIYTVKLTIDGKTESFPIVKE
jgi:hypothetical protein